MSTYDIVIVTQGAYIDPEVQDDYTKNILVEDQLLIQAFDKYQFSVKKVAWDDPDFDWSTTKAAIIRATWDYFNRIDEYRDWLSRIRDKTVLINPYKTLLWNMDKRYLRYLAQKGVVIPETLFLEVGETRSLVELQAATGWKKIVLKPAVSGAARHTYLLHVDSLTSHEKVYRDLINKEAMLFQRFQPDVVETGEWTLVLINGKYTHAILKRAKSGDFRVQDDFGGTVHNHVASDDEIKFAERAMSLVSPIPLYGRVDVIRDVHGQLALQELELIEPELWFRYSPEAANLLAGHLVDYLSTHDSANLRL